MTHFLARWFAATSIALIVGGCSFYDSGLLEGDAGVPETSTGGSGGAATTSGGGTSPSGASGSATSAGGAGGSSVTGSGGYGGSSASGGSSVGGTGGSDAPEAGCVPETDTAFCTRLGKNCGSVTGTDNCQLPRTVNCGACTLPQNCGGGGKVNVCAALAAGSIASGGTVTAMPPGLSPEDMTKAFDGSVLTKWFVSGSTTPWIQYDFSGTTAYVVTSYTITSANDRPERDPKSWRLQGSNDGRVWPNVDTQMGQTFPSRYWTNSYTVVNTTAFQMYRFSVTQTNGGTDTQLAEIQLFGN